LSEIAHGALWVPGAGMTSVDETAAARAVSEYDDSLVLGHRRDTNEWIVFHREGPHGEPFPLLSFGPRLPHPEEIKKKMYETDVRRHGVKLFHDIQRRNDDRMAASKARSSEASEAVAEALVSGFEHQGFRPFFKSLPNKNPKAKAGR
jgi:hypothetical protein